MWQAITDVVPGGRTWGVFVRTVLYVVVAVLLSLAIGYPVAYYVSRQAHGRTKAILLVLLVAPFWISYLMRMFAWTNLLDSGGYAARALHTFSIDALFTSVGLLDGNDWLGGQPIAVILGLVYGYVPYLILPLYASLDRIDQRLIEAARDLGAPPASAFRRVVLPLSKAGTLGGIVLIALPMFGDYYTPDLMSGSPKTALLGNTINNYVQGGPDKALGAALTLLLSAFLLVFMVYYLRVLRSEQ
jgi:spermidine/putrescine transport system permease protein